MAQHYAFQGYDAGRMARASTKDVPVSVRHSIEICTYLRRKNLQMAKALLQDVLEKKRAVPFRRFTNGVGHKKGMASGRYPVKACKYFLELMNSVETNAQQKGLNTANLYLTHLIAQKGATQFHFSRQRGRTMKSTHLEVVVEEKQARKQQQGQETKKKPEADSKKAAGEKEAKGKEVKTSAPAMESAAIQTPPSNKTVEQPKSAPPKQGKGPIVKGQQKLV
ncbi:50S ribosomal protein L22 [Candidatus Woesearchaeota archaeon]|nr:50S ribosomal protein L22 [Candidatus Woesearchaeota archaeon]